MIRFTWAFLCLVVFPFSAAGEPARPVPSRDLAPMAKQRQLKAFRGVVPGRTTEAELRENLEWGRPLTISPSPIPKGMTRLVYKIQPWEQIAVVLQQGIVRTIDLTPPLADEHLDTFAAAFKLGPLRSLASLPPGSEAGGPPHTGWRIIEPEGAYLVLFVGQDGNRQPVKLMRFYAPSDSTDDAMSTVAVAPFTPLQAREYQEAWAKRLGTPVELTNSLGMTLRLLPPGEFAMGSPESEEDRDRDEGPQHSVRITRPFYLGVHEVTQAQWYAVMGTRPWIGKDYEKDGNDYPVTYVSWDDGLAFCQRLSATERKEYRLPTEAEWEYACRAGTTTAYHCGDTASRLNDFAWWGGSLEIGSCGREAYAHPVGRKQPNGFGLLDMHGNVSEWCADRYGTEYYANSPTDDPVGPESGDLRVCRGGDWYCIARVSRSADRVGSPQAFQVYGHGFRVVLVPAGGK